MKIYLYYVKQCQLVSKVFKVTHLCHRRYNYFLHFCKEKSGFFVFFAIIKHYEMQNLRIKINVHTFWMTKITRSSQICGKIKWNCNWKIFLTLFSEGTTTVDSKCCFSEKNISVEDFSVNLFMIDIRQGDFKNVFKKTVAHCKSQFSFCLWAPYWSFALPKSTLKMPFNYV